MKSYRLAKELQKDLEKLPFINEKIRIVPPRMKWLYFVIRICYFMRKLTYGEMYLFLFFFGQKGRTEQQAKENAAKAIIKLYEYNNAKLNSNDK